MNEKNKNQTSVIRTYRKRSTHYDSSVTLFNLFKPFGFDIPAWRDQAVDALELKRGDVVVDIGCGTGLNFPLLYEAVGPTGKIIGVDLSNTMLDQAHQMIVEQGWQNVELVCSDAAEYRFPTDVDSILSTFALILVPDCGGVVANGCKALRSGGRFSILGMAWPTGWSLHWRYVFFWLRSYGLTGERLEQRPWRTIWNTMDDQLADVIRNRFWYGFFYLTSGTRQLTEDEK